MKKPQREKSKIWKKKKKVLKTSALECTNE